MWIVRVCVCVCVCVCMCVCARACVSEDWKGETIGKVLGDVCVCAGEGGA